MQSINCSQIGFLLNHLRSNPVSPLPNYRTTEQDDALALIQEKICCFVTANPISIHGYSTCKCGGFSILTWV